MSARQLCQAAARPQLTPLALRTSFIRANSSSSSSKPAQSKARDLLNQGFERLASKSHRKSAQERQELMNAGKSLGVSPDLVKQVYDSVKAGTEAPKRSGISPETRERIAKEDAELFAIPSPANFSQRFEYDDLPSAGHIQLEEHRAQRELVRIATWDLPQLVQYRTAYQQPGPAQFLRFKYYTFLGEDHPAARKVVLTFRPEHTGLEGKALHKLKLLAGPRFDAVRNEIRIASQRFPEQAQNRRYLGNIYSRLVQAANDASDDFADVPVDPRESLRRQARRKSVYPTHQFPAEWNRPDLAPKKRVDVISVLTGN